MHFDSNHYEKLSGIFIAWYVENSANCNIIAIFAKKVACSFAGDWVVVGDPLPAMVNFILNSFENKGSKDWSGVRTQVRYLIHREIRILGPPGAVFSIQ